MKRNLKVNQILVENSARRGAAHASDRGLAAFSGAVSATRRALERGMGQGVQHEADQGLWAESWRPPMCGACACRARSFYAEMYARFLLGSEFDPRCGRIFP